MVRFLAQLTISSNWLWMSSTCLRSSTTFGCSFSLTVFKQAILNCSERVYAASISIWESPTATILVMSSLFIDSARVRKVRPFHSLKPSIRYKIKMRGALLGINFSKWALALMILIPFCLEFMINSLYSLGKKRPEESSTQPYPALVIM